MRSLKSIFATSELKSPRHKDDVPKAHTNQTARRLAAHRWSQHQKHAIRFFFLILFAGLTVSFVVLDQTGRIHFWLLKSQIWIEDQLATRGLAAPNIQVTGMNFTTHDDIRQALGAYDLEPLSRLDPHETSKKLEEFPWVSQAHVQRLWPQNFHIQLTEKTPLVVLHRGAKSFFVDQEGIIITEADAVAAQNYPQISGKGAALAAPELIRSLQNFPQILSRFVGAIRISDRRWNLYVSPGVEVRLPAHRFVDGLEELQTLIRDTQILEKDLVALDLRGRRPIIQR